MPAGFNFVLFPLAPELKKKKILKFIFNYKNSSLNIVFPFKDTKPKDYVST